MPLNQVAKRYATALFQTTEKSGDVLLELRSLVNLFTAESQIEKFFLSPVISAEDKKSVLSDLRSKIPNTHSFLEALIDANRVSELYWIIDEFAKLVEESAGELSVELESASPLSETQVDEIRALLQDKWKKKITFKTKLNPELVGGFVARAPGKVFDASVAHQLENLREQIFS